MFSAPQPVKALPRFLGEDGVVARAATASTLPLRGPEVVLVGDARVNGRRQLTVRVRSRRGAPWLHLFVESGNVLSATIDDAPFETRPGRADVADGAPWAPAGAKLIKLGLRPWGQSFVLFSPLVSARKPRYYNWLPSVRPVNINARAAVEPRIVRRPDPTHGDET